MEAHLSIKVDLKPYKFVAEEGICMETKTEKTQYQGLQNLHIFNASTKIYWRTRLSLLMPSILSDSWKIIGQMEVWSEINHIDSLLMGYIWEILNSNLTIVVLIKH